MPLKVEKNKLTVATLDMAQMRNAAPILESEALVTSTRTHNLQFFEALPPQFLFRQQWRLVAALLPKWWRLCFKSGGGSASKVVASFRSQAFSSGGTGFRAVVSNSGSG
ncbi:hypothetical protein AVEN_68889-1 [Araneus ventricosus]|uniref:Uncharacterized protein n=1 Tax=Araneus ventricosus TaxID=182803 RepID=A0A4Y2C591_ARAVE|nr:hypothetical protein AVEN_68889-1 [Araneus ventricosus]